MNVCTRACKCLRLCLCVRARAESETATEKQCETDYNVHSTLLRPCRNCKCPSVTPGKSPTKPGLYCVATYIVCIHCAFPLTAIHRLVGQEVRRPSREWQTWVRIPLSPVRLFPGRVIFLSYLIYPVVWLTVGAPL